MKENIQTDFDNILFSENNDSEESKEIIIETESVQEIKKIKPKKKTPVETDEPYCAQCDRGDFCSAHSSKAA